jgi:hypothetical protein
MTCLYYYLTLLLNYTSSWSFNSIWDSEKQQRKRYSRSDVFQASHVILHTNQHCSLCCPTAIYVGIRIASSDNVWSDSLAMTSSVGTHLVHINIYNDIPHLITTQFTSIPMWIFTVLHRGYVYGCTHLLKVPYLGIVSLQHFHDCCPHRIILFTVNSH